MWDRAAVRIEHYRSSFDVTDPHSALGDRPDELRARAAHDQARRDVDAAKARLARDRGIEQAPSERAIGDPLPRTRALTVGAVGLAVATGDE